MNKLMIAAAGVAVAGGAFAQQLGYDYKASIKHMYLKEVNVRAGNFSGKVYQKYQKSASLKGYLILDNDGVTSPIVTANLTTPSVAPCVDFGRNRGFLVVMNGSVESKVKAPKILPAILDAKWIDTGFTKNHAATTGVAEGTLFVGGDTIAAIRPKFDMVWDTDALASSTWTDRGVTPAFGAYSDYVWTSIYLFGQFNGPNWYTTAAGIMPFDAFEKAWDAALPAGVQTWGNATEAKTVINYYHDTWMNGAGIGKYTSPSAGDLCCGLRPTTSKIIDTLSGNLKGGLFLCTENGIAVDDADYDWFDAPVATGWEDQFVTVRATPGVDYADSWQNDLWQDGAIEQETTDVLYGTWSIKYNKNFFGANGIQQTLTAAEIATIIPAANTLPLWRGIKGAALKLKAANKWSNCAWYEAVEIYNEPAETRFEVPMVTPAFATYYGLK